MKNIILFCMACMISSLSVAANYVVRISNDTGVDLHQIFVSHEETDDWEDDILDSDEILAAGENFELTLEDYDSPVFDVMGVDENGNQYIKYEINVEKDDMSLSQQDLED